ncbi:MAG: ribonuclease HI family protein [bacterium]
MQKIFLNTDGGSRGNPGNAGAGAVVSDDQGTVLKKTSKALGIMTNNEAEYQAVILGLETLKKMYGKKLANLDIVVRMDSELVCKQLNGQYKVKEARLHTLFMVVWNVKVADFPNITFTHIRREQNALADAMANEAMDRAE